jgi:hypothetical protein
MLKLSTTVWIELSSAPPRPRMLIGAVYRVWSGNSQEWDNLLALIDQLEMANGTKGDCVCCSGISISRCPPPTTQTTAEGCSSSHGLLGLRRLSSCCATQRPPGGRTACSSTQQTPRPRSHTGSLLSITSTPPAGLLPRPWWGTTPRPITGSSWRSDKRVTLVFSTCSTTLIRADRLPLG